MRIIRRTAIGLVILVALAYGALIGALYFKQRDFQYDAAGEVTPLAETKLAAAEEVSIPTGNGETVSGWYQPPSTPGKPVVLFYKGNSGSFSTEHERYEQFVADGYGFLAFDYRGFPASPGSISQEGVLEDALAAYDWLSQAGLPIVIWGRSLGSGPATYVASLREADALLLETPFLSAATVAGERYPFAPIAWLMQDKYPVNEWIAKVGEPVFLAHGTADETIGVSNGERLYELVPNKHTLWIEEGGTHGDLWDRGIWQRAKAFFESVAG